MKKLLPLILIIVVLAVGAFLFLGRGRNQGATTNKPEEKTGLFDSIKDAMSKSLSLKCEYESGQGKVTAYIKGQAMRIEGMAAGKSNSAAIIKDNQLWTWDTVKKEGVIMPLKADNNQESSQDKFISDLESQKQYCQPAVVADSVFVPPTDVKFQDLGKLMEKITGIQP